MPNIVMFEPGGVGHLLDAPLGVSVMEVALTNGVAGISADCGGSRSCATCHIHIDSSWFGRVPSAPRDERALLDFAPDARSCSRLACQLMVDETMDGLIVHVAKI